MRGRHRLAGRAVDAATRAAVELTYGLPAASGVAYEYAATAISRTAPAGGACAIAAMVYSPL